VAIGADAALDVADLDQAVQVVAQRGVGAAEAAAQLRPAHRPVAEQAGDQVRDWAREAGLAGAQARVLLASGEEAAEAAILDLGDGAEVGEAVEVVSQLSGTRESGLAAQGAEVDAGLFADDAQQVGADPMGGDGARPAGALASQPVRRSSKDSFVEGHQSPDGFRPS
jgi:hypothetical protein